MLVYSCCDVTVVVTSLFTEVPGSFQSLSVVYVPVAVAQWIALLTAGGKVVSSNPTTVMRDVPLLNLSCPELGVLWAQWESWDHTAELHPLHGCVLVFYKVLEHDHRCSSSRAWLTPG